MDPTRARRGNFPGETYVGATDGAALQKAMYDRPPSPARPGDDTNPGSPLDWTQGLSPVYWLPEVSKEDSEDAVHPAVGGAATDANSMARYTKNDQFVSKANGLVLHAVGKGANGEIADGASVQLCPNGTSAGGFWGPAAVKRQSWAYSLKDSSACDIWRGLRWSEG